MDFGSLLLVAQKNGNKQTPSRFYQTKFSAPKKETKQQKNLSENIKKFMAKKEEEDRKKALEEQRRKENLLALRDQKAQNRINKHLKVCKSANKSVIADAVDNENTAVTLAGPSQCDEDDYGYVSQEASAYYEKLMNKYSSLPPEKSIFKDDGKKTVKDIASTKDRVKQALKQQQLEESLPHKRKRKHKDVDGNDAAIQDNSDKRQEREPERERPRDEEVEKPKIKKKPMPPPIDFASLLQLAEKKQHEPLKIVPKVKEEPEKLMTKKQMKESAMLKEWKERKEQRNREPERSTQSSSIDNNSSKSSVTKDQRIPVKTSNNSNHEKTVLKSLPTISKKSTDKPGEKSSGFNRPTEKVGATSRPAERSNGFHKTSTSNQSRPVNKTNGSSKSAAPKASEKDAIAEERKKLEEERRQLEEMRRSIEEEKKKLLLNKGKKIGDSRTNNVPPPKSTASKAPTKDPAKATSSSSLNSNSVKSRPFPPSDVKPRQFPPADVKPRQFPPPDVRPRQFPPPDVRGVSKQKSNSNTSKLKVNKRRIYDEDDDEYDSELDDFIDDGSDEGGENYSKYISEIFNYDKSKYRDIDDDDDLCMESSFARQLKEEFKSSKHGLMEDLEEIKREKLENARKKLIMKKKRRM